MVKRARWGVGTALKRANPAVGPAVKSWRSQVGKLKGREGGGGRDRPPVFMEGGLGRGGRPARVLWGTVALEEEEGGGQTGGLETVSHCSLTLLPLGGKDHEVLNIHQPAGGARLPGASPCFPPPPSLLLSLSGRLCGTRCDPAGAADPGHCK